MDVVIAPTALHLGHVKAPLEGLGMQVRPGAPLRWRMAWNGMDIRTVKICKDPRDHNRPDCFLPMLLGSSLQFPGKVLSTQIRHDKTREGNLTI